MRMQYRLLLAIAMMLGFASPALALTSTSPSATFTTSGGGGGGTCPDSDGSTGASAGTVQFQTLLNTYGTKINGTGGLGCLVAGVDYHVGLPSTQSLVVPTSGNLPAGVSISGNIVTISNNNVTFQGFDMTGKELSGSNISGTIIKNNKFQSTSTCVAPILLQGVSGTTTIQYNNIDGGSATCTEYPPGFVGDINVNLNAGATVIIEYNYQSNTPSDVMAFGGPSSGTPGTAIIRYNLIYQDGWASNAGAHADGIQFCGGNYTNISVKHNTFYMPASFLGVGDTQPFHVEAQCTSAITNTTVAYNTMVQPAPSACHDVSVPGTCTSNSTIHCKNDNNPGGNPPEFDSNSGFAVYGNYLDWQASQVGIDNSACSSFTINTPQANKDMRNGATMVLGAGHP